MEKNIHSHLFASALSMREHRLVFETSPEQQQFDEAATSIEAGIENPDVLTDALIPQIAQLKVSAIANRENSRRVEELDNILDQKLELERETADAKEKTSEANADWKKITEDIKSTDAVKRDAAIAAGRQLIVVSRTRVNELSANILSLDDLEPRLLAKVTVKAIAAHNQNIANVNALDTEHNIEFVPDPSIGGQEARDALQAIKDRGAEFISTELNAALTEIKEALGPGAKKNAQDKLATLVKSRREEIYAAINTASDTTNPFSNGDEQVATLIGQLKEMTEEINAVNTPVETPAAPAAPETANVVATKITSTVDGNKIALAVEPNDADVTVTKPDGSTETKKAVGGAIVMENVPNGVYKFQSGSVTDTATVNVAGTPGPTVAPSAAPTETNSAAPTLTGQGSELLKNAVNNITALAKDVVARGAEALKTLQDNLSDKQKAELKDKLNAELKKQGATKHIEQNADTGNLEVKDGAPVVEEEKKATEPVAEVKTKLEELLDFFKKLLEFLRGERRAGGDLGVLKSELETIDEEIAKLKKDNPDFSKKPDILKKIEDLERQREEIKLKIDRGTKLNTQVVRDANGFLRSSDTPLFVRVAQDRDGNAYLACTRNTPEARGHMQYMTSRLQQVHPELSLTQRAAVDQRVYFNVYGDVNINSNNRTNNSRTINNTNTINGDNNTASNTADHSQNGNNDQLQAGGLGTANEGTAKNRANRSPTASAEQVVTPTPVVTPAPTVEPLRPQVVDVPPPTGNLPGLS